MGAGPKQARVYFRRDGKQVLVVTVHHGRDGGLAEADGPLSLTRWDDEALGEGITSALDQSSTLARDLRGTRLPGAPTLKAGGEPSPRAFDAGFIAIRIMAGHEEIAVQGRPDPGLTVAATLAVPASPSEFARQATRIFQICRDRKL